MEEIESSEELPEEQPEELPTVSQMLVAAREGLGLSQRQVAAQLYLITSYISHIDEGAFEKIPKPAFIRGYLRSYAKVVEISGDEVVSLYEKGLQKLDESVEIRDVTKKTLGSANFTGPVLQTGLIGLAGIVFVVGMVWWIAPADEETRAPIMVNPLESGLEISTPFLDMEQTALSGLKQTALEAALPDLVSADSGLEEESSSAVLTSEVPGEAQEVGNDMEGVVEGMMGVEEREPESETAISALRQSLPLAPLSKEVTFSRNDADGIRTITLEAGGTDKIEISFSGECWLQIKDGEGDAIYRDLNQAGEVLLVYGIAPFNLLFGRASSASLSFNGEEIAIARYTKADDTAKVTLANSRERVETNSPEQLETDDPEQLETDDPEQLETDDPEQLETDDPEQIEANGSESNEPEAAEQL